MGTGKDEKNATQVVPLSPDQIMDLFYHASTRELMDMGNLACCQVHGRDILLRGLIEFTNVCTNDCLYCGIRNSNHKANRYRMEASMILKAVQTGYDRGIRTFVLQGGEDPVYTIDRICGLVRQIKDLGKKDAAVTLSCGIRSREAYFKLAQAGADRYLLRFETADPKLHFLLRNIGLNDRLKALEDIRAAGFQVGSGYMVGLPGETRETRLENILLCQRLELDMVGLGPFIPHPDTPLKHSFQHPLEHTLRSVALVRLALPKAHIPATTAAGSLMPDGREQMIAAGANVLMPNLTQDKFKQKYLLYPGKICLNEKGIQDIESLNQRIRPLNRNLSFARGDALYHLTNMDTGEPK